MTRATLVIDVQQGLCEGDQFAHDAARVIGRINRVTQASRAAGAPVVFVQHVSRPGGLLERGTPPWQFADGLHVEPGDLRLDKSTPDCFERTGLDALLRSRGVSDLVICGMQTEFCVDTTTRRALALGYPVWLVADAHTTGDSDTLSAAQVIAHHNRTLALITSFGPRAKLVDADALRFGGAAAEPPSAEAAAEWLVQRQLDAYNARDLDAWLATYHPDAEQHDLHGDLLARGHDAMRERMRLRFAEPDLHAQLLSRSAVTTARGTVIVADRERITRNLPAGLGYVEMLCLYELRDGLIVKASFAAGPPSAATAD